MMIKEMCYGARLVIFSACLLITAVAVGANLHDEPFQDREEEKEELVLSLLNILKDTEDSDSIRKEAIKILKEAGPQAHDGLAGDPEAVETLLQMVDPDSDPGFRFAAAEALKTINVDLPARVTDWPMWRYDAARSAETLVELSDDLHLQWVRELPKPMRAWRQQQDDRGKLDFDISYTPVVMGNKIFVPSNVTDSVTAYDIEDGRKLWRFYADGPVRLAPAAWNGNVYFTSDDGHLYCVESETGELQWKFRGGPSDHRLLGNERIINFWAARGGPVVTGGKVYFAAGVWPMHGVFIYALDATTGELEWVNDTTSSDYVRLPHRGARGYGGLSPQGYIAADEDRLVVSPGRGQSPVYLDRHSGEVTGYSFRGSKGGGGYAVHAGGLGFRRNDMIESRVNEVSGQIDGSVFYNLAAHERLFVTTEDGTLYCFGPEERDPHRHGYIPVELTPGSEQWAEAATDLTVQLDDDRGYALMLGAGSGDLLRELIIRTELHIVVVESDSEAVQNLRDELADAGKYGRRAAVFEADPANFSVQPYLFSLVVSEDAAAAGITADASVLSPLLDKLRPYSGVAMLGAAEAELTGLLNAAKAADVDQVSVEKHSDHVFATRGGPLSGAGEWTHQYSDSSNTNFSSDTLVRAPLGVLWFGGPTNDNILPRHGFGPVPQIAHGRVMLLGPETISARCVYTGREIWEREFPGIGHPFTDLDKEKRYRQGHSVHMSNAAPFVGANMLGSPYVSMPDGVYVRYKTGVYRLDPQSGEITERFQLPVDPQRVGQPDWGHISVSGNRLIATIAPQVLGEEHYSQVFQTMEDIKTRALDGISSKRLVVMDRQSGELLWTRQADIGFRHNTIIAGNGRIYLIDGLSGEAAQKLWRRGGEPEGTTLMALDIDTGEQKWAVENEIFGTWLGYSERHDILLEGGRQNSGAQHRKLEGEPVDRAAAYRGSDGTVLWRKNTPNYHGPLSICNDTVYLAPAGTSGASWALHLKTGGQKMRTQSHTGESAPWTYSRRYGCNTHNVSEHLITFRTGYAGFFDLEHDSGTGTLSGFRSGCTNNMVVADGVLNAPDYTRTCDCSYAHQTSLAMIHMPDDVNVEYWTRYDGSFPDPERYGLNYGAPGRRVDVAGDGLIWRDEPGTKHRHSSAIKDSGDSIDWVVASMRELSGTIGIKDLIETTYRVRLHFAELDESVDAGERVFDVLLNGEEVLSGYDIAGEAGGTLRGTVEEFTVEVEGELEVEFRRDDDAELDPAISGIELIAEE